MSCPRKAPKANVDWTRIPYDAKVDLCGKPGTQYYVATVGKKRAVVFWSGHDARRAQSSLNAWVQRGRR